jgi:N-acetylglucosaminyl-diphospho-decaprenol L-rhamnosyltransferase
MEVIEIVIVTRNSAEHIGACVDSIMAAGAVPIVVDNNSIDNTLEIVRSHCPSAKIIAAAENLGYGRAMNLGFKEALGEFVILSNPDVIFLDRSIFHLIDYLRKNPRIGIVGPQQMFPDRSWQRSYGDLPGIWAGIKDAVGIATIHNKIRKALWPRRLSRRAKEVPYVDGAVMAVRRHAFLEVSGFDEAFFFYSEEADLCARLRTAGWKVHFLPSAEVIHVRGASSAKVDQRDQFVDFIVKSQHLLARKHLPQWRAHLYAKLQICHFIRLRLMYRVSQILGREKSLCDDKVQMFGTYTRIWKESSNSPGWMYPSSSEGKPTKCESTVKSN